MRHLLVTLDFPPSFGGVARYYHALVSALPAETKVDVLAPPLPPHTKQEPAGPRIVRRTLLARALWPHWLPLFFQMAWCVLRGYRSIWVGQILPVGTAALLLHKIFRIRYLVLTHGLDVTGPQAGTRRARLRDAILRSAWLVTANSEYTRKELLDRGVASEKILLLQPGCSFAGTEADVLSVKALHERFHHAKGTVMLTVARLVRRKGIDTVLYALSTLRKNGTDFQYLVAGDGPERATLQALADQLHLGQNVHFLGNVHEPMLAALYAACDIFVLTPHEAKDTRDPEGFGIVYLEANAFGKPVIGTRTGGVAEAVHNGATGLLVAPEKPAELAGALQTLLSDPALRSRLGQQGKAFVLEHCQWPQRVGPLVQRLQEHPA